MASGFSKAFRVNQFSGSTVRRAAFSPSFKSKQFGSSTNETRGSLRAHGGLTLRLTTKGTATVQSHSFLQTLKELFIG